MPHQFILVRTKYTSSPINHYLYLKCNRLVNDRKTNSSLTPDADILCELVKTISIASIARKYEVHAKSVRKWCRIYNIDYKSLSPFCI
jgi:hypothetical protein